MRWRGGWIVGHCWLAVVLCGGTAGWAQRATDASEPTQLPEGRTWTLAAAAERALAVHPGVALARGQRELAAAEHAAVHAERRPSLVLGATAFRHQEPMLVTPIHGFTPGLAPEFDRTLLQGALQLRWELWDGGLRESQVEQRAALLLAAETGITGEEQALVARVVSLYLRVRSLAETLGAQGRRLAALNAEEDRVRKLLEVGRAPEVDARRAAAARATAEADRVATAVALDSTERELARLLAVDVESARADFLAPVANAAPPAERATLLAAAHAGSAAIARARHEVEAADAAVAAARAGRRPNLRLEGNYLGFADDDDVASAEWNAGVRVGLPISDARIAAGVARAEAAAAVARERLRLAELQVEGELDRALAAHAEASARATALAEAVARSEEVVRVERLRLEVGAGVQRDYLAAEAELLAASAALVEARHTAVAASAEAARVAGALSPRWLAGETGTQR
jgi:outer membrane protein TolC